MTTLPSKLHAYETLQDKTFMSQVAERGGGQGMHVELRRAAPPMSRARAPRRQYRCTCSTGNTMACLRAMLHVRNQCLKCQARGGEDGKAGEAGKTVVENGRHGHMLRAWQGGYVHRADFLSLRAMATKAASSSISASSRSPRASALTLRRTLLPSQAYRIRLLSRMSSPRAPAFTFLSPSFLR